MVWMLNLENLISGVPVAKAKNNPFAMALIREQVLPR